MHFNTRAVQGHMFNFDLNNLLLFYATIIICILFALFSPLYMIAPGEIRNEPHGGDLIMEEADALR